MRGALFAAAVALGGATWAAPQVRPPTYRSSVELVAMTVSVVDGQQQFISGLEREDFVIYENGVPREIAFFGPAAVPVDLMLLIDLSASMLGKLTLVADAAVGFARTLRPRDRAAAIGFANHITTLQPLSSDTDRFDETLRSTEAYGRTALYDALYIAANDFRRERTRYTEVRRQVLVVLSDGRDTASLADGDEALEAVRRAGITVFTISPEPRIPLGSRPWGEERLASAAAFMLTGLARDTGGRAFFLEDLTRVGEVYADIASEIQHQYTLAYEPDDHRWGARFRQLLVRVISRPDALVRTRRGYQPH